MTDLFIEQSKLITDEYKELNRQLTIENPQFGKSGYRWAPYILDISNKLKTTDILDYGCGQHTLACNLPFDIKEYDPCVYGYDHLPEPAEIVSCCDVLEHIEPDCLSEVIKHLKFLTIRCLLLVVSTTASNKDLPDGRNSHLIQQPYQFWMKHFLQYFQLWRLERSNKGFFALMSPLYVEELGDDNIRLSED